MDVDKNSIILANIIVLCRHSMLVLYMQPTNLHKMHGMECGPSSNTANTLIVSVDSRTQLSQTIL